MLLPYYMRLLCLCFATFFVVHALSWLVVRSMSSAAVRIAETMRPRSSSRLLFALRIAPAALSVFLILGFCVPSYVWLEPDIARERVGIACLLAALMGGSVWAVSLLRGATSVVRTERYVRRCWRSKQPAEKSQAGTDVVVLAESSAVMAVAGVVHPQLVVSQTVMDALSEEQRQAAFRHEAAHRGSRDNLKKLLFLLAPDVLPFAAGLSSLERNWAKFTEWAADDEAVDGSQERALSLASALVRVAKLGVQPPPSYLLSSLMDDDRDLETRVDRLLREPAYAEKPLQPIVAFTRNAALVIGSVTVVLLLWSESLGGIHRLMEHLVQ
ncbi:MAG TPA: M56 family metallopeptidase [Candidatus Eisenbacteria bacterium]|nr:M56 family metallopeptidase [Candidatus Eisenbacteria bacterium]